MNKDGATVLTNNVRLAEKPRINTLTKQQPDSCHDIITFQCGKCFNLRFLLFSFIKFQKCKTFIVQIYVF